jgi:hypothetical protein
VVNALTIAKSILAGELAVLNQFRNLALPFRPVLRVQVVKPPLAVTAERIVPEQSLDVLAHPGGGDLLAFEFE